VTPTGDIKQFDFWREIPILVWGSDTTAARRLYKALSEFFPQCSTHFSFHQSQALDLCQEIAPGLIFYVQAGKNDHRLNKFALKGASHRKDAVLVVTVVNHEQDKSSPSDLFLEDLCHPARSREILSRLWSEFQAAGFRP
jgi:hypothetical protein